MPWQVTASLPLFDAGPMGSRGQRLPLVMQPVNALSVLVRWPQGQMLMTDEAVYGA